MTRQLDQALTMIRNLLAAYDKDTTRVGTRWEGIFRTELRNLVHAVEHDQARQAANVERAYQEGATWPS